VRDQGTPRLDSPRQVGFVREPSRLGRLEPLVAAGDAKLEGNLVADCRRFPTGLRVLVAFAPDTAIGGFEPALAALLASAWER
jgi:hypothetical protein